MTYLLYALIGIVPSVIWLFFYLRKDKHPESNSMVVKIFMWGMIIGPIAIILELLARWFLKPMGLEHFFQSLSIGQSAPYFFASIVFAAPIIEEGLKYGVVKFRVLKHPEFDEPLDAMLYMIIAALGFAAIENLLLVFQRPFMPLEKVVALSTLRFVSAIFLHALSSGLLGYWLAKSIREPAKKFRFLATGFVIAISCHSIYNFLVWLGGDSPLSLKSLIPNLLIFLLISVMALFVSYNFSILKRLHSVCKICLPVRSHTKEGLSVRSKKKEGLSARIPARSA
ncbi:MAG: PrsW family intramembrane metalloprotease [bacterium]